MKLIFVSNYFNHHQLPFCDALYELLGGDFCFLQTQPMEEERVKMGWQAEISTLSLHDALPILCALRCEEFVCT